MPVSELQIAIDTLHGNYIALWCRDYRLHPRQCPSWIMCMLRLPRFGDVLARVQRIQTLKLVRMYIYIGHYQITYSELLMVFTASRLVDGRVHAAP